jgi:capsular exopolysaccharide synthesis family protein
MPPTDPNMNAPKNPLQRRTDVGPGGRGALLAPRSEVIENPGHRVVPPAPPPPAPTPVGLLKALRRRWLAALASGLAVGALAGVGTWYFPGMARTGSYSLVRVAARSPALLSNSGDNDYDFEKYQKTQAAIVREHTVLEAALRDPKVGDLSVLPEPSERAAWLERELVVDFTAGPEVMRIMLKGDKPNELLEVVNAVTGEYLRESSRLEQEDRATRLEKVTAALARYEDELRHKRDALRKLTGGLDDGDRLGAAVRQRLAVEQLSRAEADLVPIRSEVARLQAEIDAGKQNGAAGAPVAALLVEEAVDARLQKDPLYPKQLERLEIMEEYIRQTVRVAVNPEAQAAPLRQQADALRKTIEARRQQARAVVVKSLQERNADRLAGLKEQERLLADKVKRLEDQAGRTKGGVDIVPLEDDVKKAEEFVKKVGEQAQALRLEQDAPPRVTALQEAVVLPRDGLRQLQVAGLAGFGAFGLVVFAFSWWEFRSRRVGSLGEVSQGLGLRLLGALPPMPDRVRRQLGGANGKADLHWHNQLNESIDVTRTLLLHDSQNGNLQVLLVTSAAEGEGKTSLASHLAASLARAGRKTLLVDCDLRKPAAHKLFDLPLEPGFSEMLRGEAQVGDVIKPTRLSRLWLVPAGLCDSHATQALAQENVQGIFEEMRGQFDYIILDSCPVLPVADSLLIAQHADGVIFSILRDESRLPKVYAAQQRLAAMGAKVLGAVVNGMQGDAYGSDYQQALQTAAK